MTRTIRIPIAPATATTCGDGRGKFCPVVRTQKFGQLWSCALFGELGETADGRLARHEECMRKEATP